MMNRMTMTLISVVALSVAITAAADQSGIINNQGHATISLQPKVEGFPETLQSGQHLPYDLKTKKEAIVKYQGIQGACTFYMKDYGRTIYSTANGTATCGVNGPIIEVHVGT